MAVSDAYEFKSTQALFPKKLMDQMNLYAAAIGSEPAFKQQVVTGLGQGCTETQVVFENQNPLESWQSDTLPAQVGKTYGVVYEEQVLDDLDTGGFKLVLRCKSCPVVWETTCMYSAYVYTTTLGNGGGRLLCDPLWEMFVKHLHAQHSPTGKCECTPLIRAQWAHKGPAKLPPPPLPF